MYNPNITSTESESAVGFSLRDILAALRNRWLAIASLAALGALLAALFAISLPNRYDAVATVQIDPRKKTILAVDAVLPDIVGDTPTIESQVEIIQSKAIALRVIEALNLRSDPEFYQSPYLMRLRRYLPFLGKPEAPPIPAQVKTDSLEKLQYAQKVTGPTAEEIGTDNPEYDAIAAEFADRLRAVRVRNTLIVEIRFAANNPVLAARIANTVAEVYIRDQIEAKIRATTLASELLQKRIKGLRDQVTQAELRVTNYKARHGMLDAGREPLTERELTQLMEQTLRARASTAEAQARLEQVKRELKYGDGGNVAEVLQSQTIRLLKEQLTRATRTEAELMTKYGPRHPEIIRVRAELSDIQVQIRKEMLKILGNVKNEYEIAAKRQATLDKSLSDLKARQASLQNSSVELRNLQQDAEASRQVLTSFVNRYRETSQTENLHLPDARIVEKAGIPPAPTGPKRKQIVLIGIFCGIGVGIGLAVLLELFNSGLARPVDANTALGIPHLASLPALGNPATDHLAPASQTTNLVRSRPDDPFSVAVEHLADEMRHWGIGTDPQILLMASALPNEGKTTVAANLALAMSMAGKRTLLVDTDLRRSPLTQQLGLSEMPGLLDAIVEGQPFENMLRRDTASGLVVLPAGGCNLVGLTALEALEAPGFGHRLARLKKYFDIIIIDTPPLLPVADAAIVANFVDHIVVVAAWRRTSKEVLRKSAARLGANTAKLLGIIINQVDPDRMSKILHAASKRRSASSFHGRKAA
ncbi:MAG: GumC family protein [Hyphomicrobiaceae bacterium]